MREGLFLPWVSFTSIEVRPFRKPRSALGLDGRVLTVPEGWDLVAPGDAALSRRIKADGPSWTVVEPKGNKRFSRGIWAPLDRIMAIRAELERERLDPAYQRKLDAGRKRRAEEQVEYEGDFLAAVETYLAFNPVHAVTGKLLATLITQHAVPVGSGTVARTERIPLEERAEAATIAWMRHQTTGYDNMHIPLVKGKRREVRRMLAQRSKQLLERYRVARHIDQASCPLAAALRKASGV